MAEYTGYLAPWTNEIIQRYHAGETPSSIADKLQQPVMTHYKQDPNWDRYTPFPTSTMILYILRRVGAKPPPPPIPIKVLEGQDRSAIVWRWYTVERFSQRQIAERLGVSPSRVNQLIHKHRKYLIRKEMRENRDHVLATTYGPPPPPRILGRPIDMGGPRDEWLEQGPWDSQ